MSYREKPILKLYKYENNSFILQTIIDDYQECSFEDNLYEAGQFSISINFNIPNSQLFQRGLFIQFGNSWKFGEITKIQDQIGEEGKGSQYRIITGFDARYILKRRVIKNMNSNGLWIMTGKGEIVLRNLINDQAGTNAEEKRRLPIINTIPTSETAIGKEYSASEQFSNLYEVCKTIATQSEIGWRLEFDGTNLTLVCFEGADKTQTVQFSTSFDSLANGEFVDSSESFANAIYVGGKGQNDDRDIYEGESAIEGDSPSGLDRFESWDNQSSMTTESEYETEALSMLNQYGQTLTMSGNGLAKCPYEYEKEYFTGDKIKIAFSGKSANAQILSVTEHWAFGAYEINFSFGKPLPDLNAQLQLMLRKIQTASNKTNSKDSVRWYDIPTDTAMPASDVTFNTIGFTGTLTANKTFTFYLDDEKTGAKSYNIYVKNLSGNYTLTLTTGRAGKTNYILKGGVNLTGRILVDDEGNITSQSVTATSVIESGNNQPATSGGVYEDSFLLREELNSDFDNYPVDGVRVYRVTGKNIGWVSNDGIIINLPWSNTNFGAQIAVDDQSNWLAIRTKSQATWGNWSKILQDTDPIMPTVDTTKTDANDCYDLTLRVSYYRLSINAVNSPLPGNIICIETYTYNDGTYYRITQIGVCNGGNNTNEMYIRRGYGTNEINWTDWERLVKASEIRASNNDDYLVDITNTVTRYLGAGSTFVRKVNNMVYLQINGTYTGSPSTATQLLIEDIPLKYRPRMIIEGFALLGYNSNQYVTVARGRITTDGKLYLQETAWNTNTSIRCSVIYFIN